MDYFTSKFRDLMGRFSRNEKKRQIVETTKLDYYIQFIYKVLSWEDITLTLTIFIFINFLFLLVVYCQLKFLGILFLTMLFGFIGDSYFENYQKLHLEHLEGLVELKENFDEIILCLKTLRKESPSFFFISMSTFFFVLSFIARNVPGEIIFYLTFLMVFFMPLIVSKLPPKYYFSIKEVLKSLRIKKDTLAEEELIPFIADKDFDKDVDQDSLKSDKTADSIPNSLISGISSMPSYLDGDEVELEEEDLLPHPSKAISITPGDLSSDSDSEHKGIRFSPTHFNGDTSSEEEHFRKNLKFSNIDQMDNAITTATTSSKVEGVTAVINDLINVGVSAIKSAVTSNVPVLRKDSNSDSDFEIINSEEASEQ